MIHHAGMMKFLFIATLLFGGLFLVAWLGVRDTLTPLERTDIKNPIYAVGEAIDLADTLGNTGAIQEKKIVKFGPAFWGQYPGGRAFSTIADAEQFLVENNKVIKGWAIYQLSGDFSLDIYLIDGTPYINKSLIVIQLAKKPAIFKRVNPEGKKAGG